MNTHCRYSGFTLIELLAALGVFSVLILTCGVMMRIGAADQQMITQEALWERETNGLVDQLRQDLESATGRRWFEGDGGSRCQVGWLSLNPLHSQIQSRAVGDLCAVGYYLNDESAMESGKLQRRLLRQQIDSAAVYHALVSGRARELWKVEPSAEPLADGVLVFELWPLLHDGPGSWQPWHPELRAMPEAVELRLVLASSELQARLQTSEDWDRARWNLDQFSGDEVHEVRSLIHVGVYAP